MNNIKSLIQDLGLDNVQWQVEQTNKKSLLFYKVNDEKSYELFLSRIQNCEYGFAFVCTNKKYEMIPGVSFVNSDIWHHTQELAMDELYPIIDRPQCIAVTGTNGKTTTVDFIRQILIQKKISVLTIGTLGVWHNDEKKNDFGLTTPAFIDLRKFLHSYSSEVVVFEASSHSIVQKRFYGIDLDCAIWTSFSQDHLDYHVTMEQYYDSKLQLKNFLKKEAKFFIHESDVSKHKDTNFFEIIKNNFVSQKEFLKVEYNIKNLSLAICALSSLGIEEEKNYDFLEPVIGRFNTFQAKNNLVIVDYAHTPDAIENICIETKKAFSKKLITLFGCGGDRDKSKRPLMGLAACKNSDEVIVTTDNPRHEEPEDIIGDIVKGLESFSNYKVILNREAAVKSALENKNSVILILGKGHEDYMDIKGIKKPYSDIKLIEDLQL